jgi:hypothetical protein
MKKKFLIVVVFLAIIAAVLFAFQSKINNEINSKIDELNNNGFIVKHQQSTNYINTSAKGEIEVVYPDKVASWIFNGIKDEELKKAIEEQYNLLAPNDKELLFSGTKFDYDFVFENLTSKINTNIYLTQLSKIAMNNLAQETDKPSSKWLLDFLKDKKLQVSINEKKEYKVADIDTIKDNMQRPNLHYQSGRFAKSVKVEGITRARDGALTAFLSYMRYPYATFEAGGKQGHKGYYPSRLINQSAREIAMKLTKERFTAVTIK